MLPDVYYPPRPAADQILGMQAGITDMSRLQLVVDIGAKTLRGGGGWPSVEAYETGALRLGTPQQEGLRFLGERGIKPMLIAAYGPPYKMLLNLTVSSAVPVGATVITVKESSALATIKPPHDFVTRKDPHAPNFTKYGSYYGSLVKSANVTGSTLELAAKTSRPLAAGDTLVIHRLRYPPPLGRDRQQPSLSMYKRYAIFLATEIARLAGEGYVCLWNEPQWFMDPWIPGLIAFYEAGTLTPEQRQEIGSGGMHTLLASFFDVSLPDGVRMISGATDKCGAMCAILHQYMAGVPGNIGSNFIPMPRPDQLGGWLCAEGVHPGAGARMPETQGWDPNYQPLNPGPGEGNIRLMRQRQARWGAERGYAIEMFATEAGGSGELQADETRAARHILRRVISLWAMGVPVAVVGLGAITDEEPDGRLKPKPAYNALKELVRTMLSGTIAAEPAKVTEIKRPVAGVTYPLMVCPFTPGLTFIWQRSYADSKDPGSNWWSLPEPEPVAVRISGGHEAINVRTGELAAVGPEGLMVSDDPIAVLS